MSNDLLGNLDKIHSTELGIVRIKTNLALDDEDIVAWCKRKIETANDIVRKGKNWYVSVDNFVLTINAHSYTIITAHTIKQRGNNVMADFTKDELKEAFEQ